MESIAETKKVPMKDSFFWRLSDATASSPATNLSQIQTGGTEIIVKGKTFEFKRKDAIFNMRRPVTEKNPGNSCKVWDKEFKKSSKKQKYCDFWGDSFWKDCFKERNFPKPDKNGIVLRGKICLICDRKFIAKDIQLFYEEQISKKEDLVKKGERTLNTKKEKLDNVLSKIEEMQKEDQTKQAEFENDMEDLSLRMEVIQNQIKELNKENDKLQKRIQMRNEEAKNRQYEQLTLTGDVDGLKTEIALLENRLTKLKTKYEETWSASGSGRGRNVKGQNRKNTINGRYSESVQSSEAHTDNLTDDYYAKNMTDGKGKTKDKKNKASKKSKRSDRGSLISQTKEHQTKNSSCSNCIIF